MADNTPFFSSTDPASPKIADDEVSYNGDLAKVQLIQLVTVGGPEGGHTGPTKLTDFSAAIGAQADAAATTDTGTFSLIALIKRQLGKWTTQLPAALTAGGSLKVALVEAIASGSAIIGKLLRAETTVAGTIVIGTSTTVGIAADVRGYSIVGLVVPSTFDGSVITFQTSHDGSTFQALYDATNTQVSMTIAASRNYAPWAELQGWSYIKIVCGTAQTTTDTAFVWLVQS